MSRPTPRPFNLGDLMILVAAVAVGISLQKWVDTPIDPSYLKQFTNRTWSHQPATNWYDLIWIRTPSYHILALTIALILMRWRSPRPSARRVVRQPGAVACLAVLGAILYGFAFHYLQKGLYVANPDPGNAKRLLGHLAAWDDAVRWVSPAVLGVWTALAWSGGWKAERSWLDRAGRFLGVYWLMYAPISQVCWPFFKWLIPIPYNNNWGP